MKKSGNKKVWASWYSVITHTTRKTRVEDMTALHLQRAIRKVQGYLENKDLSKSLRTRWGNWLPILLAEQQFRKDQRLRDLSNNIDYKAAEERVMAEQREAMETAKPVHLEFQSWPRNQPEFKRARIDSAVRELWKALEALGTDMTEQEADLFSKLAGHSAVQQRLDQTMTGRIPILPSWSFLKDFCSGTSDSSGKAYLFPYHKKLVEEGGKKTPLYQAVLDRVAKTGETDLHAVGASILFQVPIEDVTKEQRATVKTILYGT